MILFNNMSNNNCNFQSVIIENKNILAYFKIPKKARLYCVAETLKDPLQNIHIRIEPS